MGEQAGQESSKRNQGVVWRNTEVPRLGGECRPIHIIRIGPSPLTDKHRTSIDNPGPEAGIPLPFRPFLQGQDIFVSVFKIALGAVS